MLKKVWLVCIITLSAEFAKSQGNSLQQEEDNSLEIINELKIINQMENELERLDTQILIFENHIFRLDCHNLMMKKYVEEFDKRSMESSSRAAEIAKECDRMREVYLKTYLDKIPGEVFNEC